MLGRVVARRLGQDREIGHLGQREILHVLAEIALRRRLDAIGVTAEEDLVEVDLHDLLLGERAARSVSARIASRTLRFTEYSLPVSRFLATCWVIVDPPRARSPEPNLVKIFERAVGKGQRIDAVVGEEGLVLGRDERIDQQRRQFRYRLSSILPFAREGVDRRAVDPAHDWSAAAARRRAACRSTADRARRSARSRCQKMMNRPARARSSALRPSRTAARGASGARPRA